MTKTQNLICTILEKKRELLHLQGISFQKNKQVLVFEKLQVINEKLRILLSSNKVDDKWRKKIMRKLGAYYFDKFDNGKFVYDWDWFDGEIPELRIAYQESSDYPEDFSKMINSQITTIASLLSKIQYESLVEDKLVVELNEYIKDSQQQILTSTLFGKNIETYTDEQLRFVYKNILIRCGKLLLLFLKQDLEGINRDTFKDVYEKLAEGALSISSSGSLSYSDLPGFIFPRFLSSSPSSIEYELAEKFEIPIEAVSDPEYIDEEKIGENSGDQQDIDLNNDLMKEINQKIYNEKYEEFQGIRLRIYKKLENLIDYIESWRIDGNVSHFEIEEFSTLIDRADKILSFQKQKSSPPVKSLSLKTFDALKDLERKELCKRRYREVDNSLKHSGFSISNMTVCGSILECLLQDLLEPYQNALIEIEKNERFEEKYAQNYFKGRNKYNINNGINLLTRTLELSTIIYNNLDNLRRFRNYTHPNVEIKAGEFDPQLASIAYSAFIYFVEHFDEYQIMLEERFGNESYISNA